MRIEAAIKALKKKIKTIGQKCRESSRWLQLWLEQNNTFWRNEQK